MSLDDALAAVDDALLALDEPDYDEPPEPPLDVNVATARLARLGRLEQTLAETVRAAQVRKDQIDAFVDREFERIGRETSWLRESLRRYHEAVLRLDATRKTLHLPTGDLISRMGQAEWMIVDEAALIDWLDAHAPAAVRRPPPVAPPASVDRNAMKAALVRRDGNTVVAYGLDPETGERPPGLIVNDPERRFTAEARLPEEEA